MSLKEKIAGELNHFLKIMNQKEAGLPDKTLSDKEKKHSISLMRVNASGEVAAQALYRGKLFLRNLTKLRNTFSKQVMRSTSILFGAVKDLMN